MIKSFADIKKEARANLARKNALNEGVAPELDIFVVYAPDIKKDADALAAHQQQEAALLAANGGADGMRAFVDDAIAGGVHAFDLDDALGQTDASFARRRD